jgi:hypothetical protein
VSTYYAGTQVVIEAAYEDIAGTPTDPTFVSVTVEAGPGGAQTTYTFAADGIGGWSHVAGTGIYQLVIDTTGGVGQFTCEWQALGAVKVPGVWIFDVIPLPL